MARWRAPAVSIDSARLGASPPRPPGLLLMSPAPPSCLPRLPSPLTSSGVRSLTSVLIKTDVRRSKTSEMPLRTVCRPPCPPSQRSAAPTHYPSRHGSPDPDDLPDDQLHHLLAIVQSRPDKRTRRSKIAADRHFVKAHLAATPPVEFALGARVISDCTSDNSAEFRPSLRPEIMPDSD